MQRSNRLVRGLVDWLLGGISARLDFVERDVQTLQEDTKKLEQGQQKLAQQVMTHHQQLVALRKMHALLADRVNQEFPGKKCEVCGSALIFRREATRNAYSLKCPNGCGQTLLLPEILLLNTLQQNPPESGAAD
ncbi:MAG TPA: hypothetical protein VEU62_22885 [Bryobacterales bacterium]|nr:hypothetical protein [Bryobacterales bacterium]